MNPFFYHKKQPISDNRLFFYKTGCIDCYLKILVIIKTYIVQGIIEIRLLCKRLQKVVAILFAFL